MTYVRSVRRDTHPLPASPGGRARRRSCSSRASAPTSTAGTCSDWRPPRGTRPSHSTTAAPAAATSRTARTARTDGRRCDRRARPRRQSTRHTSSACLDGRRDQPDHRGQVSRADPFADAGLHGGPQPSVARRTARRAGATRHSSAASASMGKEAARWVIGPRSFRRLLPALGVARSAGTRPAGTRLRRAVRRDPQRRRATRGADRAAPRHRRADARRRRQPGHPHAAGRQRGSRRPDPDRRAGRDQRGGARLHGRARHARSTGCCSSSSAERRRRTRHGSTAEPQPDASVRGLRRGRLMRVVVIGAGMAGLVAARTLHDESGGDIDVVVVDKGRRPAAGWRPGGSVTRRSTTAPSSSPCARRRSDAAVDDWIDRGLVHRVEPRLRSRRRLPSLRRSRPA